LGDFGTQISILTEEQLSEQDDRDLDCIYQTINQIVVNGKSESRNTITQSYDYTRAYTSEGAFRANKAKDSLKSVPN
jgi:hypothetical protein